MRKMHLLTIICIIVIILTSFSITLIYDTDEDVYDREGDLLTPAHDSEALEYTPGQEPVRLPESTSAQLQIRLPEPEPEHEPETEPENEAELEIEEEPEPEIPRENPFSEAELLLHAGNAYYSIYFFSENILFQNDESPMMPSASVIKVFIMYYAYRLIEQGELSEDDLINGQRARRLIEVMIQHSDNNATNVLINHFGMQSMNQFFAEQGFNGTVVRRRMLDFAARSQGYENFTTTADSMEFLQRLYNNRLVFPYNEMLEIMKGQAVRTKIPLFLPSGTVTAHKTGELGDVENDMGIVFTEDSAFAIVVLTSGVRNGSATRQAIGHLTRAAFDFE